MVFTHLDHSGQVRMVDVTEKVATHRVALAQGVVKMQPTTLAKIMDQRVKKGNVLETARIAGILGAKKTSDMIPMCHPLNITHVKIDFYPDLDTGWLKILAEVRLKGQTGVEMEALTAVSIAALTIYDMCKSEDKQMTLSDICLLEKSGGKSGTYRRE